MSHRDKGKVKPLVFLFFFGSFSYFFFFFSFFSKLSSTEQVWDKYMLKLMVYVVSVSKLPVMKKKLGLKTPSPFPTSTIIPLPSSLILLFLSQTQNLMSN